MNNNDLKSIINTACKYNDNEVLEKIASSKFIKTAGVRDLLEGLGLQISQTANESQFKNQAELTRFLRGAGTVEDREAATEVYDWWAKKIKELGQASQRINVAVFDSRNRTQTSTSFQPANFVKLSDLLQIWNMLPTDDIHKIYGYDPNVFSTAGGTYNDPSNTPLKFDRAVVDHNGDVIWPPPGPSAMPPIPRPPTVAVSPGVDLRNIYVKIIKGGSGGTLGYLDLLRDQLKSNPPKIADNAHVKIFDMLNTSMSEKAMSSMIRKNALAETPRAGLISNWKYIVSLPKEIENRMAKTPKTLIDYKQKLALKKYGRDLSQILNHRIKFEEFAYQDPSLHPPTSTIKGLQKEIPFYKINELSNSYFMEPIVMTQIRPLIARTGELLNKIIPELDKDTSLTRNVLKSVVTPTDYLNTRGKEFH